MAHQEEAIGIFEELRQGEVSTFLLPIAPLWVTGPMGLAEAPFHACWEAAGNRIVLLVTCFVICTSHNFPDFDINSDPDRPQWGL